MAYQTALTIESVIKDIDSKKYLLPSIQREFVWSTGQIEKLFDSLMRDYPINAFLFWKVPREKVSEFKFYEFLRDYHQKDNKHNPKANTNGTEDIIAILDGQQRMTSLYIALKGTYAYKMSYKRWDNPAAYPKRKLYLNLLAASDDADMFYDFLFLTEEEAKNIKNDNDEYEGSFWFPVGKILDFREESDVNDYLIDNDLNTVADKAQAKFANKALFKLYSVIHNKQTISYYLEESTELDKVLNIFIRVNSGGTTLSYSDLLLSFATAQWEHKDAREEINEFVEEVNMIGRGFNIGKDLILKSCLVLADFVDITFKVDNFNRQNMLVIENLLWTKYGSSDALVVLSVLYPWADLKNVFHIDHIYPKSQFTERRLKKKGVASDAMEFYMNNVNYLGNLQLLDGTQNKEKNDSDFDVWLADNYKDSSKLKDYKEKNYIPDVSLAFTNFEEFFTEREKLLVNRLKKELM